MRSTRPTSLTQTQAAHFFFLVLLERVGRLKVYLVGLLYGTSDGVQADIGPVDGHWPFPT